MLDDNRRESGYSLLLRGVIPVMDILAPCVAIACLTTPFLILFLLVYFQSREIAQSQDNSISKDSLDESNIQRTEQIRLHLTYLAMLLVESAEAGEAPAGMVSISNWPPEFSAQWVQGLSKRFPSEVRNANHWAQFFQTKMDDYMAFRKSEHPSPSRFDFWVQTTGAGNPFPPDER